MLPKKRRLIAATDKRIFFAEAWRPNQEFGWTELDLPQFLSHEFDPRRLAAFRETRSEVHLIVPDHWFKHEFFVFKSKRDSLIRAFIERKLKIAYPHLPLASHFFNYRFQQRDPEGAGIRVFHLFEPASFDLYEALCKTHLPPRWITSAALLWEERFKRRSPEFPAQAALLIHLQPHEAYLYFYFHGNFLFSRAVALPESAERWDALLFEVNQSIYLFSQKAKSDLNVIYLIGEAAGFEQRLSELLSRPVQPIAGIDAPNALPRELSHLEGLLDPGDPSAPSDAESVAHRRTQLEAKWRPVQWAGMLIAALLILFFLAEHLWLDQRLRDEVGLRSQMRYQQPMALADYDAALVELIQDAQRPSVAQTILKIVSALPEQVMINEFKMDSDALRLDLAATVTADSVDQFRIRLKTLTENMNRRLKLDPPLSMEDVVFHLEEAKSQTPQTQYRIAWKISLP
jgi:hypothetical protein